MKIYLFNPETGIYLGEDFVEDSTVFAAELPAGATKIAPPSFERREVPVFLAEEDRWELRVRAATPRP